MEGPKKSSKENLGSDPIPSLSKKNPVEFLWDTLTIQNDFSLYSGSHIFPLIQALFLIILFDFLPVELK